MSSPFLLNFTRLFLLSFTLFCLCNSEVFAQTQTLTLEPTLPSRIAIGDEPTVKVKITPVSGGTLPSIDTIQWDGMDGFLRIKSKLDEGGGVYSFTFETLKVADALEITVKVGGDVKKTLTIKIVPRITKDTLELTSPDLDAGKLKVKQQNDAIVRLKLKDGNPIPADALKIAIDAPDIAKPSLNDSSIVVTGRTPGTAKVTISVYDKEVQSFNVEVIETIKEIKAGNLTFTNGDAAKSLGELGIQIVGKNGTVWSDVSKLDFFSKNTNIVKISPDGTKLEIVDAGETDLEISAKEDSSKSKIITVKVAPKAAKIVLDTGGDTTLIVRQKKTLQATVQDEAQRVVPDVTVKFTCEGANCAAVNVIPKANNSADIVAISQATAVKIVAKVDGKPGVAPAEFLINVIGADQITDFHPLLIRLDPVDEQTAKDLFGRKAADEFYITKVQLFNNIKKTKTEYYGDSILVYSESLQVRVALEVKCRKGDAISECTNNEGKWIPITVEMIKTYFNNQFSLSPYISDTEPRPGPNDVEPCHIQAPIGFVGLYRPYSFDTIAVTHDRRDERSIRSRILTVLNGAISFTSFVTAIAVPGSGSDLPLGLDKSNNLLIPSFEKLFPSMKEVQRQNILTMVMRNLEEIPFGGSIERKIFFPKGALEGLWPGHRVRISGISTFDACAEAAIIKKVGQQ